MIILDVETTGLYPKKNSIGSIGALDFSNPANQFYEECRIWDGAEISQQALEINGFTKEELRNSDKQSLETIIKKFIEWADKIDDKTIAGENPSFDRDFLIDSIERYGIKWRVGYRTVDLHSLVYSHHLKIGIAPPRKDGRTDLNTDKILEYLGLPKEPKPHRALTGAKMEAEAFSRLIYRKSLLEEFKNFPIPPYLI